ncbi:MAG: hypothetical protein ACREQX_15680 [Candidatus Binataceae bacterium]
MIVGWVIARFRRGFSSMTEGCVKAPVVPMARLSANRLICRYAVLNSMARTYPKIKRALLLLYRAALGGIGVVLILLGFALLLVPMLGILLLWIGVVTVAGGNWSAESERTIVVPAEAAETTGVIVRLPDAIRAGVGAFGMAVTRTVSVSEKPRKSSATVTARAAKQAG